MAAYADWGFYQDEYGGTALTATEFDALIVRAGRYVDYITFQRSTRAAGNKLTAVKLAACAVAEALNEIDAVAAPVGVASEKVGGHSVAYAQEMTAAQLRRLTAVADVYLEWTGLLYAGVR